MSHPTVLIYREWLLPFSETFILNQAESFERFVPWYIGCRRVAGLSTPRERSFVLNDGSLPGAIREVAFRASGRSRVMSTVAKGLEPSLIHAHFGPNGANALTLSARLGLPLVVTFHGYDATIHEKGAHGLGFRRYMRRRPLLAERASLLIAVSGFVRDQLVLKGFPSSRVIVHYIGVDLSLFAPKSESLREPIVLFVGRMTERKGCHYLLAAMARVQSRYPGCELILIGDGPQRASLELYASRIVRNARFLGVQDADVIRAWMARASALAVPSITLPSGESEGLGMVCAEAQAMGLPVVGFDTGGIPEIVRDGVTGFVVPAKAADLLAHRLELLLEDQALWRRMSLAGRAHVEAGFDLHKQSRELEELYSKVLLSNASSSTPGSSPPFLLEGEDSDVDH